MAAYEARGESDDWHTPAYIFAALGLSFDLDVAAPVDGPRHVPCLGWLHDRALETEWRGLVWMNPPFGHQATKRAWLAKFFAHKNGVALVPDRTSAPWWQEFAPRADAVAFLAPKVKFERADGSLGMSPGTGTCLFALGATATAALVQAELGFTLARGGWK